MSATEIAKVLGGAKKTGRGWLARCCCHKDFGPSLSLRDGDDGLLLVHCFGYCDPIDVLRELRRRKLLDDPEHCEQRTQSNARRERPTPIKVPDRSKLEWLMSKLRPIERTVVETYLRSRGVDLPPDGHHLRYLSASPPRHPWPCMVGIVTDFADANRVLSLHFTRLRPGGQGKAPLPKDEQRSFLAGFPIKGGVIRLSDYADVTLRQGVAEGIETALGVSTSFRRDEGRFEPVEAALSAGNLGELALLAGIETLVIYADRGPAGEAAADRLAQRWLEASREVFIARAPVDDWNPAVAS